MKRWSLITVLCLLVGLSCKKDDGIPSDIPGCIKLTIEAAKQDTYGITNVTEYEFQGQIVYVLTPSTLIADASSPVYDASCKNICSLGGLGGVMTCNGEKFFDKAIKKRVIWTR